MNKNNERKKEEKYFLWWRYKKKDGNKLLERKINKKTICKQTYINIFHKDWKTDNKKQLKYLKRLKIK